MGKGIKSWTVDVYCLPVVRADDHRFDAVVTVSLGSCAWRHQLPQAEQEIHSNTRNSLAAARGKPPSRPVVGRLTHCNQDFFNHA